ncbi:hypothetical protein V6N12_007643 [Hibiscus sabdariffa]|uniref:CCHC-type domain-containing protein n=1 Tax=Hibiscus sabdariffa TaxID=183260 RepID=A0ABR2F2C9_9ROSI
MSQHVGSFGLCFWVRVHDLPLGLMSEVMARQFGNFLGQFVEYDSNIIITGKQFMRVKVLINVNHSLKRKKKIAIGKDCNTYVHFKYEKITLFCFICGKIGHGESLCPLQLVLDLKQVKFGWDLSIRAPIKRAPLVPSRWLRDEVSGASLLDIEACRDVHGKLPLHGSAKDVPTPSKSSCSKVTTAQGPTNFSSGLVAGGQMELGSNTEDNPISLLDGKKRKRTTGCIFYKVQPRVTASMNAALIEPFRAKEVWHAVKATWKVDILESLFDEVHVNKIRAIPLSKTRLQDKLVWRYDGLGSYTVKSGYRLLNGELNAALLLSADSGVNFSRFYAALWSSNLPPKVNIAMWRIINNYMPTLVNLRFRQLTVDVCCPLCKSTEESIEHIMRECAFVKQILDAQGVRCSVPVADLSWKECLAQTFVSLSMRQRQALMITFYSVWYTRNQVLHEGLAPSVSSSISFVEAFLSEHDLFNSQASPRPLRLHDNWVAPAMSVIKLNFDASYDASPGKFVSGVLCRDNDGFILVACSKPHSHVADPFQAEALACLVAVTFAKDLGFTRVIVEGDSFTIIKKCASEAIDVSLVSPVVADIKR